MSIPDNWFEGHDGQSLILDPETVEKLFKAAAYVVKQWEHARVDHQPLIEALVDLRGALKPRGEAE